jgi:hypothetical protein
MEEDLHKKISLVAVIITILMWVYIAVIAIVEG